MAGIEPVFFRHSDTGFGARDISIKPYDVCVAVAAIIGNGNIDGAQNVWGIWRIYCTNDRSRAILLTKTLKINGKDIVLFDKNPRVTNNSDPSRAVEKIIVKDIPLSVDNTVIDDYLKDQKHVKFTSNLRYSKERNHDGELTNFRNGDRYIYAESPVFPPLPSVTNIGGHKCRIYHQTQKLVCKTCGQMGHRSKSEDCPAYATDLDILGFKSYQHVLSNFYPCNITYRDEHFKSAEHAYQYAKAVDMGKLEIAHEIKAADNAFIAKGISRKLPKDQIQQWEKSNCDIMREIIEVKAKTVPEFVTCLRETAAYTLAEATSDLFWGTGLNPELTEVTKPEYWAGKNILGAIIMDVRERIFKSDEAGNIGPQQCPTSGVSPNSNLDGGSEQFPPLHPVQSPPSAVQKPQVSMNTETVTTQNTNIVSNRHVAKQSSSSDTSTGRWFIDSKRKPSTSPEKDKGNKLSRVDENVT